MNPDKVYFHFTSDKLRDGSPIPPVGEWLIYPGKPIICQKGLHASKHPSDALKYAPGNILHMVELKEITESHEDKVVAVGRKILYSIDSTELLGRSARKYAGDVLHLWNAPEIVRKFIETGKNPAAARVVSLKTSEAACAAAGVRASEAQRDYFLKEVLKEFNFEGQ